jgi:hypothetical protein
MKLILLIITLKCYDVYIMHDDIIENVAVTFFFVKTHRKKDFNVNILHISNIKQKKLI